MMDKEIDYRDFIDIAKISLANKINEKMAEYKSNPSIELKKEIIKLMQDRKELYLFNLDVVKKYI